MGEYIKKGQEKLNSDMTDSLYAMELAAKDGMQLFLQQTDKGLDDAEREALAGIIFQVICMGFCYGYGVANYEIDNCTNLEM